MLCVVQMFKQLDVHYCSNKAVRHPLAGCFTSLVLGSLGLIYGELVAFFAFLLGGFAMGISIELVQWQDRLILGRPQNTLKHAIKDILVTGFWMRYIKDDIQ